MATDGDLVMAYLEVAGRCLEQGLVWKARKALQEARRLLPYTPDPILVKMLMQRLESENPNKPGFHRTPDR